jgi:hypothetical protein
VLDKVGIGLSALCVLHCLALPVVLVALPLAREVVNEWVHIALLFAVVPVAGWALVSGASRHRDWRWAALGGAGVVVLMGAHPIADQLNIDVVASVLTVLGALTLAVAHVGNRRGCCTPPE